MYQQEAEAEKVQTFEEYSGTKQYQLQQELFKLVESKIGSGDKDKVQRFYSLLQQHLRKQESVAKVDQATLKKIQSLILDGGKLLDDKKLFSEIQKQEGLVLGQRHPLFPTQEDGYFPLRHDMGDSSKDPQRSQIDYDNFMFEQREKVLDELELDLDHNKGLVAGQRHENREEEAEEEGAADMDREENEFFDYNFSRLKNDVLNVKQEHEVKAFGFDKVSADITGLKKRFEVEDE